jgi:hypothetical protein
MKHIIWLSPSLAAGAIAARLVAFFEKRPQIRDRRGVERAVSTMRRRVPAPSPALTNRTRCAATMRRTRDERETRNEPTS